jgi:hypothetical protein
VIHRPVKNFLQETHHPLLESPELKWISPGDLMKHIEERAGEKGGKPKAIVFDLDSTLFCTSARLKSILHRYISELSTLDPLWIKVAHDMDSAIQRYSVPETLFALVKRYRNESEAETLVRDFWPGFRDYWTEAFFSSRNMMVDPPYAGSVEFVKKTVALGYSPIYLTGRDYERGMEGTRHALRRWDYPLGPDTHTMLKPDRKMLDMEFKKSIARVLHARFEIHFVIDNEPENLAMFAVEIPMAEIVFFHSIMSRRWINRDLKRDLAGRKIWGIKSFEL